jgi:hypothetical protein
MFDAGGFQIGVEIESRAGHSRSVSSDGVAASLPCLLPEPGIESFAGERGRRDLHAFSLGFEVGVGLVGEGQVEVLHTILIMPFYRGIAYGSRM